ncbi:MAG: aminoglycoside phosphotransferase family protein [Planctomycetales bacterium]|nr:aminoglycoside phosphotransferase family protein [Planctomycetales bacterium]
MQCGVNKSIADRDPDLPGLNVLLNAHALTEKLCEHDIRVEGIPQIIYVRYKPGRRCISLVQVDPSDSVQWFVLTALTKYDFLKQFKKGTSWEASPSRQEAAQSIRIDRFPFDPGLKHVAKCFDETNRQRLFRRIFADGSEIEPSNFGVATLAYKPGKRYVAVGCQPQKTFKFYCAYQYMPTLRRLLGIQSADIGPPKLERYNERYRVAAFEWVDGHLLSDALGSEGSHDATCCEVGRQLARLHHCRIPAKAELSAIAHPLEELAGYIAFLVPELKPLADEVVSGINASLVADHTAVGLIHGDFYAKQVICAPGRIRFIDFDQAGLGNPYRDVGNFVAKLYWQSVSLNQELTLAENCAESFLRGYRHGIFRFDEHAYRVQLSAGLVRCATHPFRRARKNWPKVTERLLLLARSVLRQSTAGQP